MVELEAKVARMKAADAAREPKPLATLLPPPRRIPAGNWTPQEQPADTRTREEQLRDEVNRRRWSKWEAFIAERGKRYEECGLVNFVTADESPVAQEKKTAAVKLLREFHKEAGARIERGAGILLFGPKGSGKDHLMCSMVRSAIGAEKSVEWRNGMDLYGDMRDLISSDESEGKFIHKLTYPDVLYISDPLPPIGKLTEYQTSMLFRILDARYSAMKSTWVTVNVNSGLELDERLGPQNGDRLRDGAVCIHCDWQSYRKRAQ